ncbi:hypothetical protein ACGF12_14735 [Kitasatospora sp. NPDC048296]|uniref:hypothetical protein n=1 Tax=Kitasatospora sp. NPDC048296 TaxID=3364048 RepID=UPI00371D50E4
MASPTAQPTGAAGKFTLVCVLCRAEFAPAPVYRCPSCSGALEPRYAALATATRHDHADPEQAYFDFLPLVSRGFLDSGITVRTPCRPAPRLGEAIGVPGLWIKDESQQPCPYREPHPAWWEAGYTSADLVSRIGALAEPTSSAT